MNQWAADAVAEVTGLEVPKGVLAALLKRQEAARAKAEANAGKNPAAVALGRRGGLKGGKARAKALSAKERKDIARKAAQARWTPERRAQSLAKKGVTQEEIVKELNSIQAKIRELTEARAQMQEKRRQPVA